MVVVADPQLRAKRRDNPHTANHRLLEWFKPGTESRRHEAGYAANRCTHDFLEPKTGSVASTEDASPPRRYPR